jgi:hypothetical protein
MIVSCNHVNIMTHDDRQRLSLTVHDRDGMNDYAREHHSLGGATTSGTTPITGDGGGDDDKST